MAEIFLQSDARSLIKGKKILLLGDSNVRALYKDLVWLLKCNSLIDVNFLKRRLEKQFLGDELVHRSELTRGRSFTEHRCFKYDNLNIEFIFITRCYSAQIENLFGSIKDGKREAPDVIYMNSCLWDICRWGPNGVKEYQVNMRKLMKLLTVSLPKKTLFIWGTAVPTASTTSGGLIIKQLEFIQAALRVHVMEANRFTSSLVSSCGFDVLDFHFFMHYQVCRRSADGIHFLPHAIRFMTNLLLTHIALNWDIKLPKRIAIYPGPLEMNLIAANQIKPYKVERQVKKMDEIASNISTFINPAGHSGAASSKKRRNKKKSLKNRGAQFSSNVPKTPPQYHKATQPTFDTPDYYIPEPPRLSGFAIAASYNPCNQPSHEASFADDYNHFHQGPAPVPACQYNTPPSFISYYNGPYSRTEYDELLTNFHRSRCLGQNQHQYFQPNNLNNREVYLANYQYYTSHQLNPPYYIERFAPKAPKMRSKRNKQNANGGGAMRANRGNRGSRANPYGYRPKRY